jgi:heat shock protein HtpX
MGALVRALFFVALPMAWAETPAVMLHAHLEANGEVTIQASSPRAELQLGPVLPAVIHCQGREISDADIFGESHCYHALRRDGLSLEGVFDLAPIAQQLAPTDEIQFRVEYPRLGFEVSSTLLEDQGSRSRSIQTARFTAGAAPAPIRIRFGYHADQLTFVYLPLLAMAMALMLIAMGLSRAGRADLSRSVFVLGTIFWLGTVARLQAAEPLRILLSGTPLSDIAATFLGYFPPLLCVAAGVALGGAKQNNRRPREMFAEVFWGFGMLLFPLAGSLAAVPLMVEGDWIRAGPWLMFATVGVIACRWRIRASSQTTIRELSAGELKDRVSELAAKLGAGPVRVFVSSSARSQISNAFAMRRNSIILTAPLIQSISKREVDAVVAHEVSHFGHARRRPWAALALAAILFEKPLADITLETAGGVFVAVLLVPVLVYFAALRGARKREFAADAGSVALTGDPRAMISALARIARNNRTPLDFSVVAEWFSTHPSTHGRIRALAAAAGLETAQMEALCNHSDPGAPYPLPPQKGDAIFTLAWQTTNATRYGWTALIGASGAGLLVASLLDKFAGVGFPQLIAGVVIGSAVTKVLAATVMSINYARLRRKLANKLNASGQLVGLAVDSQPRVYNGYRFSDVGFVSFQGGRFCYRSERISIELNAADVVDVSMVAAAPSTWRRFQPMVRFLDHDSGEVKAFILHPVEWGASPRRLLQSILRWKETASSAESTSIHGLSAVAGQPYRVPNIAQTARGFRIPGAITLIGATLAGWFVRGDSWLAWYALVVTACSYTFMYLPAMLYRPSQLPPVLTPRVDAE